MSVYIDTSAFYAIVDTSDLNHHAAASVWQGLLDRDEALFTSSYVVTETIALLHNRLGTAVVRRFVEEALPAVQIRWIDQATHDTALTAMLAVPGKRGPSLTDCANLVDLRQLKVQNLFAYDQHFADLGIGVLG